MTDPYRASDEVETLRRENASLRADLELLCGETLYPFSEKKDPCRKCGALAVRDYVQLESNGTAKNVKSAAGPDRVFQPATPKRFWKKATPERFKLSCQYCKAVYYERPKT